MRAAMVLLAAACVGLGVGPTLVLPALARVVGPLVGSELPALGDGLTVRISGEFAALSPLALAAALAIALLRRWARCGSSAPSAGRGGPRRGRAAASCRPRAWSTPPPRSRIPSSACSTSSTVRRRGSTSSSIPSPASSSERIDYASPTRSLVEEWLYRPALATLSGLAAHARRLQSGSANTYLAYILAALVRAAGARVITDLVLALTQALVVAAGAPLLVGALRTLKARLVGRRGPRPWQPYADLAKLLRKEAVVSTTTSWVFRVTPYVLVATMLVAAVVVPVVASRTALPFAGIILLMYLFLLGTFFLALAGLDAGSAFGGMGASREVAVAALAEPTVILAVFALALRADTTNLGGIVAPLSPASRVWPRTPAICSPSPRSSS